MQRYSQCVAEVTQYSLGCVVVDGMPQAWCAGVYNPSQSFSAASFGVDSCIQVSSPPPPLHSNFSNNPFARISDVNLISFHDKSAAMKSAVLNHLPLFHLNTTAKLIGTFTVVYGANRPHKDVPPSSSQCISNTVRAKGSVSDQSSSSYRISSLSPHRLARLQS